MIFLARARPPNFVPGTALFVLMLEAVASYPALAELYPSNTVAHGTAQITMVEPGRVVAASDSKEISYTYLSDGTTNVVEYESCKIRRSGGVVLLGAGFVRANEFNALDEIRNASRAGEQVSDVADRVRREVPGPLGRSLEAARKVGDSYLKRALAESNALEITVIGTQHGQPAAALLEFRARMIGRDHINIETSEHRCPGDCPGGRAIYRTGLHEAIDKALASGEWTESATPERASELLSLEYASRPDVAGGPKSLVEVRSLNIRFIEAGACASEAVASAEMLSERLDAAAYPEALKSFQQELDRRIVGVSNVLCHQILQRQWTAGDRQDAMCLKPIC